MTSTSNMKRNTRSKRITNESSTLNDHMKTAKGTKKSVLDCDFESIEKKIFEDVGKVSTASKKRKSVFDEKPWSKVSESINGKHSKTEESRSGRTNTTKNTKPKNGEVKSVNSKDKVELNKKSENSKIKSTDLSSNSSLKSSKKVTDKKVPKKDEKITSKRKIDKNTPLDDNKLEKKSKSLKTEPSQSNNRCREETTTKSNSSVSSKTKEHTSKVTKEQISVKSKKDSSLKKKPTHKKSKQPNDLQESESEMSDWEDVDHSSAIVKKSSASNEMELLMKEEDDMEEAESSRIQIELDAPTLWGMKKRKKRKTEEEMIEDYLRKSVNQGIRESYVNCHKVHLLLLLGHGQHLNKILNSEEVLAAALSIVTNKQVYPPKRTNIEYIEKLVKWYIAKVNFVNSETKVCSDWKVLLLQRFGEKGAKSKKEFILMFVILCRALGMSVRLVQSLAPLSWKPTAEKLFKPKKSREDEDEESGKIKDVEPISVVKPKKKNKMISSESEGEAKLPPVKKKKDSKKSLKREKVSDSDFDSDFEEKVKSTKRIKGLQNKTVKFLMQVENGRENKKGRVDVNGVQKRKDAISEWVEIYVEDVEGWVCVDVIKSKIYCADEFASRVPPPVGYITAFNPDQTVKDVTKRYVSKWLSHENKLRCDSEWWTKVLGRYSPPLNARERKENESLEENLRKQPLPKTISEFKNHPMYALQRHLLKYEALYPPNPDPLGFIRGEPVFPRECVKTLHSRDIWLKQAKTVKVDEEAYKVVTAMPKWDRVACKLIKDRPLDLFGDWQVENYKPPVAKNGKVPRNEYGNVELFKPEMLPIGCVHLNSYFEDLSRICRKLQIDCAPAMVGFDFHKGGTHPVFDGYIICEEFEEIFKDAWKEEMELKRKREESRRQKRVLDNWKRMTKSLLVKHHVREVYGDYDSDGEGEASNKAKAAVPSKKRKVIKQKDIESARESVINADEKVELGIDLKSDTVTMAKKCIKNSLTSRGTVAVEGSSPVKRRMIESSDEDEENKLTEEQKKEKLRNILNWGKTNADHEANLGLSDDSDDESSNESPSFNIGMSAADLITNYKSIKEGLTGGKTRTFKKHCSKPKADSDIDENVEESEESTDMEDSVTLQVEGRSRRPKRKAVKKAKVIVESEEEDISLGESDFDDKTYKPEINVSLVKVKKQRSMLSDDSE